MNASPSIEIHAARMITRGILEVPPNAQSIIVFAQGTDSYHLSPRNRLVARSLLDRGLAVLLPALTDEYEDDYVTEAGTEAEEILSTANRLASVIDWITGNPNTRHLKIGLFGGRTGAATAMIAAALRPDKVHAVVSRGGRPDLAEELLADVHAPTLMIVGSKDHAHLDHNRKAGEKMRLKPMLEVIQGANHLFGEPGKLEQVASISYLWYQRNLAMCG